jgi:molybdenum cofactor cytidylyltransferase
MTETVGAVVLAAGLSKRMGRPKMLLPWGETTIIGQVVKVLSAGGASPVIVVTGGTQAEVAMALADLSARLVHNPQYANGEMLESRQTGIKTLPPEVDACLVALGDQPQIEEQVVRAILAANEGGYSMILVPSYIMRRGHPWLVRRDLWPDLLRLTPPATARDFLLGHAGAIQYLELDRPSVLLDLDTPEDYRQEQG